jgi:iron(III) transport system permease protein
MSGDRILRIWRGQHSRTAVIGAAITAFVVCCVLPVAYLLATTLGAPGAFAATVLLDSRQRGLLYTTALLGVGTATLATAIGAPLGIALARVPLRRRGPLRVLAGTPVLLPPYIVALAWVNLGWDWLSKWTYSLAAAVVILSLVLYPLSMLATEVAMRRVDGRLEEAGLIVAPPGRVLRGITLPLVAPSVIGAALIIFVLAVSEFGVPGLLGVRVYTTEVFTAFAGLYDFGRAIALAVPLLVLCLAVAAVAAALLGDRLVTTRRSLAVSPVVLHAWRWPALVGLVLVIAMALALPMLVLIRQALGARSFATAIGSIDAIVNSLLLAAVGATLIVPIAVCLGYAQARASRGVRRATQLLVVVLFAVPSTIIGVGLIGLWNRPGPLGVLYGTDAMLLLAYLARFVPVATLILAAATQTVSVSQEEASAASGVGWLRAVRGIVLPQLRVGVGAAWVVAFVLAFGELGASILVAPPGEATLPILIYTIIANTPSSNVAMLALLQSAVIFVPVAAFGAVASVRESR